MRKLLESIYNNSRKIPKFINKYFQTLTKTQKEQIKEKIDLINSKYNSIISLKKPKHSHEYIDPMFFSFENLPPFGKEYWFMKFVPEHKNEKSDEKRQLLLMFGRCTEDIEINKKYIKAENAKGKHSGFMSSWFFDKRKNLVVDDKCSISILPGKIIAEEKNTIFKFTGKYPKYNLKVLKRNKEKNKEICSLEIRKPENSKTPYKFSSFFKLFAGFGLINLYFDFSGKLNGKVFNGKCYVQKVALIGPFIPWYWGRIIFADGSILKYYMPQIGAFGINYKLLSNLVFYNSQTQKSHIFKGLKVKKTGTKLPQFIITDGKNKFHATIETYSSHEFLFSKTGRFRYTEYLGRVSNIRINNHDITKKLGRGIGLIEEAKGYVL